MVLLASSLAMPAAYGEFARTIQRASRLSPVRSESAFKPASALLTFRSASADSDPVTANDERHFLAILIERVGAHRLRIFIAQLEDVPDFDGRVDAEWRTAIRAARSEERRAGDDGSSRG